jgi:methyl-accepting chemotaxis protein
VKTAAPRVDASRDAHSVSTADGFCLEAMPVLAKQIENARVQSETAILELSTRFRGIVASLDGAVAASEQGSGGGGRDLTSALDNGKGELLKVVAALKEVRDGRAVLIAEIRSLTVFTQELAEMASEVQMVALKTNMLALNAAIEAAHAGSSIGAGFAVVAQEVRLLSVASRATGKSIGAKVGVINDALKRIVDANDLVSKREEAAVQESEARIGQVLAVFGGMTERLLHSAAEFRGETETIKDAVMESMVQLQFQDRVGQILAHVVRSMDELRAAADAARGAAYGDAGGGLAGNYMANMARTYTTEEQRRIHEGSAAQLTVPQAAEFF